MNSALKELLVHVRTGLEDEIISSAIAYDELTIKVHRDHIIRTLMYLKEDGECLFESLVDISGVDYPERPERFDVVYHLLSYILNIRIRVKVETSEDQPVPSATSIYHSANWFEREIWDLYGVMFSGHPDLRRILTDYGFQGHPLRKDFPLTGYVEVRYSEEQKRVVYEPVKLPQDFRRFDFMSPWESAKYILPGDDGPSEDGGGDGDV